MRSCPGSRPSRMLSYSASEIVFALNQATRRIAPLSASRADWGGVVSLTDDTWTLMTVRGAANALSSYRFLHRVVPSLNNGHVVMAALAHP